MLYFYTLKNTAQGSHTGYLLLLQLHFPADIQGNRKEFEKSRAINTVRGTQAELEVCVHTQRVQRQEIISTVCESPDLETDLYFF